MSEEKASQEDSHQSQSHDERVTCNGLGWVSYMLRAAPQQQSDISLPDDPALLKCVGLRFTSSLESSGGSDGTGAGGSSSSSATLSSATAARGTPGRGFDAPDPEDSAGVANERPAISGPHTPGLSGHKGKLNSSATTTSVALFCAGQLSLTMRNNYSSYQPLSTPRCNGLSMRVERPANTVAPTTAPTPGTSSQAVVEEAAVNSTQGIEASPGRPRELPSWLLSQLPFAGFVTRHFGPPTPENYEQAQQSWEALKGRVSSVSSLMGQTARELEGPQHFFKQTAAKVGKICARSLKILQRTGELLTLQNRPSEGSGEDDGTGGGGGGDQDSEGGGNRSNRWGRKPGTGF